MHSDVREAVVTSIDETTITFELDGQRVVWPKKQAPKKVVVGDRLTLMLMDEQTYQAKREDLAKLLLNEIFRDNKHQGT